MCAPDLIDPAKHTVLCPSWPGNGSTWQGFDDPHSQENISVAGLADDLKAAAKASANATPDKSPVVIVNADQFAMHQMVINVLEAARIAGYDKLTFAAQTAGKK